MKQFYVLISQDGATADLFRLKREARSDLQDNKTNCCADASMPTAKFAAVLGLKKLTPGIHTFAVQEYTK